MPFWMSQFSKPREGLRALQECQPLLFSNCRHHRVRQIEQSPAENYVNDLVGNSARLSSRYHCGLDRRAWIWANASD
jgi:hypothetical protein